MDYVIVIVAVHINHVNLTFWDDLSIWNADFRATASGAVIRRPFYTSSNQRVGESNATMPKF